MVGIVGGKSAQIDCCRRNYITLRYRNKIEQSLVAAQHFFSVNLANFSPHLLLILNLLNCLQSQSNFLILIWLYIKSIVHLNLIPNLGILYLSLSF